MSDEIEEFGDVGAGASTTYPQQCSALRKGGHVMIKGKSRPMYVVHFLGATKHLYNWLCPLVGLLVCL